MKLGKLIGILESQFCISDETFTELKKRKKEVKAYFSTDEINVVAEIISNNMVCYYCDFDFQSHYDIIQKNELEEELETGHLALVKL